MKLTYSNNVECREEISGNISRRRFGEHRTGLKERYLDIAQEPAQGQPMAISTQVSIE